ncbi:MAG: Xaa-Pro peptidase family protein [Bacteroidetes bacterium]|nr:Xaa-Pro peptidase family protein [Bacteroidota bacterium]
MSVNRRKFIGLSALTAGTLGMNSSLFGSNVEPRHNELVLPEAIRNLSSQAIGIVPISVAERKERIAKAQTLMAEAKMDAIFLEGTTSCYYFTGMRWGQSERTFGVVIPAKGAIAYVCPKFEEDRARELILPAFGEEVRCWEEHESPYAVIVGIVKDRGVIHHTIGMEERVRFFIANGVKKEAAGFEVVDATPVTAGCRMIKSPAEIALMQKASDVTIEAYKASFTTIVAGMSQTQLSNNISAAFKKLGFSGGASVQVGKYSALPHGSITPQTIKEGDVVMVDGGTSCEGYASDITRTIVVGKPTQRQIDVWNVEKKAQDAAFAAIKIGAPCEQVDAAARAVIENAGFSTNYKLPGLPHRTGHGIGLEGHEWTNFVKGNKTPIAVGMCFSDEPTISIPGEFGIRLEDCVYIAADGPKFFSKQSISIDQPFG